MIAYLFDLPRLRRHRESASYGMWLALLAVLLISAITFLAVRSVSLGDMRVIGTDNGVTSGVMSRLIVAVVALTGLGGLAVRSWAAPAVADGDSAGLAQRAGVIRIVAGASLLLVALVGSGAASFANLLG